MPVTYNPYGAQQLDQFHQLGAAGGRLATRGIRRRNEFLNDFEGLQQSLPLYLSLKEKGPNALAAYARAKKVDVETLTKGYEGLVETRQQELARRAKELGLGEAELQNKLAMLSAGTAEAGEAEAGVELRSEAGIPALQVGSDASTLNTNIAQNKTTTNLANAFNSTPGYANAVVRSKMAEMNVGTILGERYLADYKQLPPNLQSLEAASLMNPNGVSNAMQRMNLDLQERIAAYNAQGDEIQRQIEFGKLTVEINNGLTKGLADYTKAIAEIKKGEDSEEAIVIRQNYNNLIVTADWMGEIGLIMPPDVSLVTFDGKNTAFQEIPFTSDQARAVGQELAWQLIADNGVRKAPRSIEDALNEHPDYKPIYDTWNVGIKNDLNARFPALFDVMYESWKALDTTQPAEGTIADLEALLNPTQPIQPTTTTTPPVQPFFAKPDVLRVQRR